MTSSRFHRLGMLRAVGALALALFTFAAPPPAAAAQAQQCTATVPVPCPVAPPPPAITEEAVSLSRVMLFDTQHRSSRYERYQNEHIVTGPTALKFRLFNIATGGAILPMPGGEYGLVVDGVDHSKLTLASGAMTGSFAFDPAGHAKGWRRIQVREPSGALSPSWFIHIGTTRVDDTAPVATSVYSWTHGDGVKHRWAMVPWNAKPAPYPVPLRMWPSFNTPVPGKELHLSQLVPSPGTKLINGGNDVYSAFNRQSYFFSDLVKATSPLPLLDGPAGTATMPMATHIEVGRATATLDPASKPVRATYVLNSWALARIDENGTKKTLVGLRGWPGAFELVGDWSAIPVERRGLREAWAFRFKPSSLTVDVTAPLIDGRPPHIGNPIGFIADTQHNRILKLEADGRSHDTPWKVTEFITGLGDPFGMVVWENEIIVSERLAHRISAWDADTGAFKRVVLQCTGTSDYRLDSAREPIRRTGTLEAEALARRRALPCIAPEGMDLVGDTLYFGSWAQAQVRRLNLRTGALSVQGNVPVDGNSNFMIVAVSRGDFGPEGTAFATTWSIANSGFPVAIKPDGTQWYYRSNVSGAPTAGRGPVWGSFGYGSAVGVGLGRMVFSTSDFAINQVGLATAADPVVNITTYKAGKLDPLLYVQNGHSPYGYPLPWGKDAATDYRMTIHGHTK